MAKLKMQRIELYALRKDRKKILDDLQRMGVVEICDTKSDEEGIFQKDDNAATLGLFEKNYALVNQALIVLDTFCPQKKGLFSSLEAKKHITTEQFDEKQQLCSEAVSTASEIVELNKKIAELTSSKLKLFNSIESLTPWLALDIPTSFSSTRSTKAFIGSFPEEYDMLGVQTLIRSANPSLEAFDVSIISADKKQTCVFILCTKKEAEMMDEALKMSGFIKPTVFYEKTPAEEKANLTQQISDIDNEIEATKSELIKLSGSRGDIQFAADYYSISIEKYEAIGKMIESKNTFMLSGYIIKNNSAFIENYITEKYPAVVELKDATGKKVPVALKNNSLTSPCESVVESFSMPGKSEIDPTAIMSIFYYVFFGLMLADAVYGLIMFLGCFLVLRKYKEMGEGIKKMLSMFMYCGITTAFWGVMFGSYCGDAVDIIASVFFNKTVSIPALWLVPLNEPMRMLMYSLAFGIVHLLCGLGISGYQQLRDKDIKSFVYDTLLWFGLVLSLLVMLLPSELFASVSGMSFDFGPVVAKLAPIVALVCSVGIILTAGRSSKNWFKRILKGLYGLYGISSWLSDVLSYSRLLALGLASGVIATVVNKMAAMVAGGLVGKLIFIVIFIGGHVLNIAINLLGAYVHTNRSQFVEFFGKFYEGGGKKFVPLANNTKYYKIQEETN